jgi:hypothetical protein
MYAEPVDTIDINQITPKDIQEWFPDIEHRVACRVLWDLKSRSNGRHSTISREEVGLLLEQ